MVYINATLCVLSLNFVCGTFCWTGHLKFSMWTSLSTSFLVCAFCILVIKFSLTTLLFYFSSQILMLLLTLLPTCRSSIFLDFFWSYEVEIKFYFPLLLFSCYVMSDSLRPHGLQHTRLPCPPLSTEFAQTHVHWVMMLFNHLIFWHPLPLLPSVFPSIRVSSN